MVQARTLAHHIEKPLQSNGPQNMLSCRNSSPDKIIPSVHAIRPARAEEVHRAPAARHLQQLQDLRSVQLRAPAGNSRNCFEIVIYFMQESIITAHACPAYECTTAQHGEC